MRHWIALWLPLGVMLSGSSERVRKPEIRYVVRVDSADLSGWEVELRLRNLPPNFQVAMAAHPEYDDRYWRFLSEVRGEGTARVERQDSSVWRVSAPGGAAVLRYRLKLPPPEGPPRAAWRPFLSASGGFLGGPHTFLYVVGAERAPVTVTLQLPQGWDAATGLTQAAAPLTFAAANAEALVEAPILIGRFHQWSFTVDQVPHRVVYWSLPGAPSFDSTIFVSNLEKVSREAVRLFGRMPYRDYTFLFQDGAYGGLEHPNSVTLGLPARDLASSPYAGLPEAAHEFFHTWNLMAITPAEYQSVAWRTQPPVAGLWFSEGLTIYYSDLLMRRAGLPVSDSTRTGRLERLIARYLFAPGNWRHSAEEVARVAYNAPPGSLGDYSASTHLQGEVIGSVLDLKIRDATDGRRSMDDVMRLMLERFAGREKRGFLGRDVEQAVEDVCGCEMTPFFEAHVRGGGAPIDFDGFLAPFGLRTEVRWAPAEFNGQRERDLRIFGWAPDSGRVRLVISDAGSSWGKAGLHTGDDLVSMNGETVRSWPDFRARLGRLQLGDSVRMTVRRPTGEYSAVVRVSEFERPTVRLVELGQVTERQRRLRETWLALH